MRRSLLVLGWILILTVPPAPALAPADGVLPVGADGKPLNFNFETGSLKDWTASGDAFRGQPIKGDTVYPRRNDMRSQHQGQYWIGTYERSGDGPQGTLTSVPFKVTHPWASFLVGGGPHETTCVELVRQDSNQVFSQTSGLEEENLRRAVIDLRPQLGKEIFIRLVDRHSGHWGHINFDDFRFHAVRPDYPARAVLPALPPPDLYRFAGLAPQKAAQAMTVPKGFEVKLFAGEPDVRQPIAFCLDDRGRLWVAEAYCYPVRRPDNEANDRILIFEDTDGDGVFDKRTVFLEHLNLVSGLEVGFGGVWIGAAPYLLFVPIKPGTDQPAGPPQVLLDGWAWQDTHETLNTFTWGPDGWLYGCHGVFTHSHVGKPGAPAAQRTPINAGIWRYHPTKHVFEVFAHGTSNPWGLDFNDRGQAFSEACVVPHAFHIIQGARYFRQAGNHFNPYTYADIATIADHLHYPGADPWAANNRSDSLGGGHAHCGTMIYLGGAWPAEFRDQWFMGNIHGRRINMDRLRTEGSGYIASHGPDFLLANDAWARFINLRYGPDGNAYLIDWYDQQACHTGDVKIWDRSNGRIYKICYQGTKPVHADLQALSDDDLVKLQLHPNDWFVRHARRLLQERGGSPAVHDALAQIAFHHKDETRRLRGLWALHAAGGLTDERVAQGLADTGAYVRAWTIQLALENGHASPALLSQLTDLAQHDPSPVVRLYLASGLQRLPGKQRWDILAALVAHSEDATDHNLPLMTWYAAEPLADLDPARALALGLRARGRLLEFMVRRISSSAEPERLANLVDALARSDAPDVQRAMLQGLHDALQGHRQVPMPARWPDALARLRHCRLPEVREQAQTLAVTFGDERAMKELRQTVASSRADFTERQKALDALLHAHDKQLPPLLHHLIADPALRGSAVRGLAAYDDPHTPEVLIAVFGSLSTQEKHAALGTLAARASYGKALLDAVAAHKIPAADVTPDLVRQLRNLHDPALDRRIADVWGVVRDTPIEKARLMAQYRKMLTARAPSPPDLSLGRALYAKTCGQCHVLFGTGGKVGPELTGSNRANLDYLLENILDPSAVIPKEYTVTRLELTDGRVITGIIREETAAAFTVITATETLTVPRAEVESTRATAESMMPEDQLKPFTEADVRALIAYLQSPAQVPILATADSVKDFFDGKDLTGWDGDAKLWQVDHGVIVGRGVGLKQDALLRSQMVTGDFRLTLKIKGSAGGVVFRGVLAPDGQMRGLGVSLGKDGVTVSEYPAGAPPHLANPAHFKDWNDLEIVVAGSHSRIYVNGGQCTERNDDSVFPERGMLALLLPAGASDLRIKDLHLEVLPNPRR
jgi:putative membrane-bound dehydrogenase-like protein